MIRPSFAVVHAHRVHHHYLKGALWCGRCGRRFIIMRGRGNGGTYFYFICRGRQGLGCTQPYLRVEAMETAVARHYNTVRLSEEFRTRVRGELDDALLGELGSVSALKQRLSARLTELDGERRSIPGPGRLPRLAQGETPPQTR